jgi:hypothetical protein
LLLLPLLLFPLPEAALAMRLWVRVRGLGAQDAHLVLVLRADLVVLRLELVQRPADLFELVGLRGY